jgi:hypothetical protein
MKSWIQGVGAALAIGAILYLIVAAFVFDWRNPKANKLAKFQHLGAMLSFEKVEAFQE